MEEDKFFKKKCKNENCYKRPCFNFIGKKDGIFCSTHKENGMINVKDKSCKYQDCNKRPNFNFKGNKTGIFCSTHKENGMINVKDKTCKYQDCNKRPNFNFNGNKNGNYCKNHKLDNMIDVTHKKCKTYLCPTQVKNKYNGYCYYCFIHLFPDNPLVKNYKSKEKSVTNYIITNFPEYSWITDKSILDGCSKRRPDLFLDLGFQVIIIEVDENQHIDYDCTCENKRLMELSKDINHRNLVFIRFNPDDYLDLNKKKIKSCWKLDNNGIIKISNELEWNIRLSNLADQLKYWINNKTDKMIEVIQLYYNQI
jgi:hypothetical protein